MCKSPLFPRRLKCSLGLGEQHGWSGSSSLSVGQAINANTKLIHVLTQD